MKVARLHRIQPLMDIGGSIFVAFDPTLEDEKASPRRRILPLALETAQTHVLHECAAPMTSSLLLPNDAVISRYENLANLCQVVQSVRDRHGSIGLLEDIAADFLKIDVQGATLLVLQNGLQVLEGVLVVHTEVEFAPIYTGQPLFGEYQPSLPTMALNFIISRTLVRRGSLMCPAALHSVTHSHAICGQMPCSCQTCSVSKR